MPEAIRISLMRRLANTPLRDWIRGRLTMRLDWRGRVAQANLPAPAAKLILRVVKRTRLWRIEKSAVADELISHFLDAIEAGESTGAIIQAFGNEKQSAKLIRRSKIRNRPLLWHLFRWCRRGVALLIAVYVGLAAMFFLGHPSPTVDYLAQLNRPLLTVPDSDRAWPLYRQVILTALPDRNDAENDPKNKKTPWTWLGDNVDGKHWPEAEKWLHENAASVEMIRQACAKPAFGFVFGPDGSVNDEALWPGMGGRARALWGQDGTIVSVLLPALNYTRTFAEILQADAKLAETEHDAARVERDILAMQGLSRQLRAGDPFLVTDLVASSIDALTLITMQRTLLADPKLLSDDQLIRLAHRFSIPKSAADLITFQGERMAFDDLVEHCYTDDGHGDGRMTADGMRYVEHLMDKISIAIFDPNQRKFQMDIALAAGPGIMVAMASRKDLVDKYNGLCQAYQANLHLPLRDVDPDFCDQKIAEQIRPTLTQSVKYAMLNIFLIGYDNSARNAEIILGQRDGLVTAIALELYHRQHGDYPKQLDDLVPTFLPAVPADRITGEEIKYRLSNGVPLLYSVGWDRIDDGGVPAMDKGEPIANLAAQWRPPDSPDKGDWILYPIPPAKDADDSN